MKNNFKVLHVMPHIGGGVGKALSTLVGACTGTPFSHAFLLLEIPEKKQFFEKIKELGCEVYVTPDAETTDQLINNADIVQLEWWNHPAIFKFLCKHDLPDMRLLIWCHVSGIHTPIIPSGLVGLATRFLFTSACSLEAENLSNLDKEYRSRLGVVSSGVGFPSSCSRIFSTYSPLRFGYMGSLNFSKLHPQFINFLSAVSIDDFKVSIWGDDFYKDKLISQCEEIGKPDLTEFKGYTTDPATTLSTLDVFVYLLNPLHYGTAENVLLEAMSLGVVPIVLNNAAESAIVENGETGLVIRNPKEFAAVVEWLVHNLNDRKRMSKNAAKKIAKRYSPEIMSQTMISFYNQIIPYSKCKVDFRSVLGKDPYDWYMACQENNNDEFTVANGTANYEAFEETKGSLKHFLSYFSEDTRLKNLANYMLLS